MPKWLFILLGVIVILLFAYASSDAGEIHGNVGSGYIPEIDSFVTEINVNYTFNLWKFEIIAGVGYENLSEPSPRSPIFFSPYRIAILTNLQVNFLKNFYVRFDHSCTHPVWSYKEQFWDKFQGGNRTTFSWGIRW